MKRTALKRRTPLRAKVGLNRMSRKASTELGVWLKVKRSRMESLHDKFGYIPCEYCLKSISYSTELFYPEGHHNDHNRRNNSPSNCRILHRVCNQAIEDKNIKDVPSLLTLEGD